MAADRQNYTVPYLHLERYAALVREMLMHSKIFLIWIGGCWWSNTISLLLLFRIATSISMSSAKISRYLQLTKI